MADQEFSTETNLLPEQQQQDDEVTTTADNEQDENLMNDEDDSNQSIQNSENDINQIMDNDDEDIMDRELEDDASEIDDIENETLDPQNESDEKEDLLDHESDQDVVEQMDAENNDNLNYDDEPQNDDEIEYEQNEIIATDNFEQNQQNTEAENQDSIAIDLENDYNGDRDIEDANINNLDAESSAKLNAEEYDEANSWNNDQDKMVEISNTKPQMDDIDIPRENTVDRDLSILDDNNVMDDGEEEEEEEEEASPPKRAAQCEEIGVQTVLLSTEIKLGSKTKKRIAVELGQIAGEATNVAASKKAKQSSMSPIKATRQMRSSSQKIAKIIGEHKAQLKVMFDRYSNGLTNKIKLDGLTRMLKDRNILKKISLVPEITKAFHKSSFTDKSPDSLTFDEFLQCIIRMANDLLSRKKKSKYKSAESRVSLFLAKLHLRPFPKENELDNLSNIVSKDKMKDPNKKSIASELTPKIQVGHGGGDNGIQMQFDYRLSEKQLDSEFDLYFNTGGFFSDANSSVTGSADVAPLNAANLATQQSKLSINSGNQIKASPLSPSFKKVQRKNQPNAAISKRLQRNGGGGGKQRVIKNKKVKPSPLQKKRKTKSSKKVKNVRSSYQALHHQPAHIQSPSNMNGQRQQQAMNNMYGQYPNEYNPPQYQQQQQQYQNHQPIPPQYQQQQQQQHQAMMSSPNGYQRQSSNSYSDYYEPQQHQRQLLHHHQQQQLQHGMQSPPQAPYSGYNEGGGRAMNNNLTQQEQQLVQRVDQKVRNRINGAVQPSHRSNSRRHR